MNNYNDEINKFLDSIDKKKEVSKEVVKKNLKPLDEGRVLDTIQEQIESPMTTSYSPQSIRDDDLKNIELHPENYIEINFIKKIIGDSFYIPSNIKSFEYNKKFYNIIEENIYILPTKKGFFMPTCFFKEDILDPVDFKQKNKGISGKVLSLLYDERLYNDLFSSEEGKYNLYIVIFLFISISSYLVGLYFLLGGGI